jgi:hypothetical protein
VPLAGALIPDAWSRDEKGRSGTGSIVLARTRTSDSPQGPLSSTIEILTRRAQLYKRQISGRTKNVFKGTLS